MYVNLEKKDSSKCFKAFELIDQRIWLTLASETEDTRFRKLIIAVREGSQELLGVWVEVGVGVEVGVWLGVKFIIISFKITTMNTNRLGL